MKLNSRVTKARAEYSLTPGTAHSKGLPPSSSSARVLRCQAHSKVLCILTNLISYKCMVINTATILFWRWKKLKNMESSILQFTHPFSGGFKLWQIITKLRKKMEPRAWEDLTNWVTMDGVSKYCFMDLWRLKQSTCCTSPKTHIGTCLDPQHWHGTCPDLQHWVGRDRGIQCSLASQSTEKWPAPVQWEALSKKKFIRK